MESDTPTPDDQTQASTGEELIAYLNAQATFEDPVSAQEQVLRALSGPIERLFFTSQAVPLLERIGLEVPAGVRIIDATLKHPGVSEAEVSVILKMLFNTKSAEHYREGIQAALEVYPDLDGLYGVLEQN